MVETNLKTANLEVAVKGSIELVEINPVGFIKDVVEINSGAVKVGLVFVEITPDVVKICVEVVESDSAVVVWAFVADIVVVEAKKGAKF